MTLWNIILGLFPFVLSVLRAGSSVITSDDSTPKWCERSLLKFPEFFQKKCEENGAEVRLSFCCKTCKGLTSGERGTISEVTIEPVTTAETTKTALNVIPVSTQYLMYTEERMGKILCYTVGADYNPVKQGEYKFPFKTKFPGLAFNNELQALEIIGDHSDRSNKIHSSLTPTGSFSNVSNSLFDGDRSFEVVNCENAGTLVISNAENESIQVYIITQNTKWNLVENSNKHLKSFRWTTRQYKRLYGVKSFYFGFGMAENENKIYLIGGSLWGRVTGQVMMLNLDGVNSLQDAQAREWMAMPSLKNALVNPAVVFFENQLLVVGSVVKPGWREPATCGKVQFFDLKTNTTGVYNNNFTCGLDTAYGMGSEYQGIYAVEGGHFSIFGGGRTLPECFQQYTSSIDTESEWTCVSQSKSILEASNRTSVRSFGRHSILEPTLRSHVRFSNFVIKI